MKEFGVGEGNAREHVQKSSPSPRFSPALPIAGAQQ
jgi:hypothetical protein